MFIDENAAMLKPYSNSIIQSIKVNLGQMKKPSVVLHAVLGNFAVTIVNTIYGKYLLYLMH